MREHLESLAPLSTFYPLRRVGTGEQCPVVPFRLQLAIYYRATPLAWLDAELSRLLLFTAVTT